MNSHAIHDISMCSAMVSSTQSMISHRNCEGFAKIARSIISTLLKPCVSPPEREVVLTRCDSTPISTLKGTRWSRQKWPVGCQNLVLARYLPAFLQTLRIGRMEAVWASRAPLWRDEYRHGARIRGRAGIFCRIVIK